MKYALLSIGLLFASTTTVSAKRIALPTEYVQVLASHTKKNPKDPVTVKFTKYSFEKAGKIDPKKLTGAKGTLTIDVSSIDSGNKKRDAHLLSPDFINSAKHNKIVIDILVGKKLSTNQYKGKATVKFRGFKKTWKINIEVISRASFVFAKVSHEFSRADFKVGPAKGGSVAPKLTAQALLRLQ